MNKEIFAEFLLRQGKKIIKTESCYWYNAQPGFYFYFPYHKLINPSKDELKQLMKSNSFIGARYFIPPGVTGRNSFLIVCEDKNYNLESVDAKYARRQTRRGLEHFTIRQFDLTELVRIGLPLVQDTLIRQGRSINTWNKTSWAKYCESTYDLKGFETWGAFFGNQLAAFMIAFIMEDHFTILHHSSATQFLPLYSNNALVYEVTRTKLSEPNISCVFYGPESLDAPESLDKFKFRMGFVQKPMKQKIVFNPLIKPFITNNTKKCVHWVSEKNSSSDFWRKIEGVIDFYQET